MVISRDLIYRDVLFSKGAALMSQIGGICQLMSFRLGSVGNCVIN